VDTVYGLLLRKYEKQSGLLLKMDFKNYVKPCDWVKYFDNLYSRKSNSGLVYETQLLGPPYIEKKNVPLHAMEAHGWRGGIAPTHT
jgi:hypothetical protein